MTTTVLTPVQEGEIAVVNGYNRGALEVTILTQAKGESLVGRLASLSINSNVGETLVLARIVDVSMANPIHSDGHFHQIIADNGGVEYYSGDCDVWNATVEVISAIDKTSEEFTAITCPPHSGSRLRFVDADTQALFRLEKEHYFNVGHLPGQPDNLISLTNRSFGKYEEGGYGEAKHCVIIGQNGSGKTVLALAKLAGQLVANSSMGCLVPDTAGDITKGGSHSKGEFVFNFIELLEQGGRMAEQIPIDEIRLTSKPGWARFMAPFLRSQFNMAVDKAEELARRLADLLFDKKVEIDKAEADEVLNAVEEWIEKVYTGAKRKEKLEEVTEIKDTPRLHAVFRERYEEDVAHFFRGRYVVDDLIKGFLTDGRIYLINMASLSSQDQQRVMHEIFTKVKRTAEVEFKIRGTTFNGIIALDEGPRWVPQSSDDEVSSTIVDAYNTTRKYGIGWMIISQRIASIKKDVVAQAHTLYLGRGLGVGADLEHIKNALGADGLIEYNNLSLMGGYFWMAVGHEVNLGQGNKHVAFHTFGGDSNAKIKAVNPHIWG